MNMLVLLRNHGLRAVKTAIALALTGTANADIIRVTPGADPGNSAGGGDWTSDATNLQRALVIATAGDEIWLMTGVYHPDEGQGQTDNDRSATFTLVEGVAIYGGFQGGEVTRDSLLSASSTVLSGDIDGDDTRTWGTTVTREEDVGPANSYHVVTCPSGLTQEARLSHLTLNAGNANGAVVDDLVGAGLTVGSTSNLVLENVEFLANRASWGAAVYNSSDITFLDCDFEHGFAINSGGGIYNTAGAAPTFDASSYCYFSDNHAQFGADMFNSSASPELANCRFVRGETSATDLYGGAVYNNGASSPVFTDCEFDNAVATTGGAIYNATGSSPEFVDCEFEGNEAADLGGAIYNATSADATLRGCTLSGNDASYGGGLFNNDSTTVLIEDSTFLRNTANLPFATGPGGSGGGIYNDTGSVVTMRGCEFEWNSSYGAGAVQNRECTAGFHECVFARNEADDDAGAVRSTDAVEALFINCVFRGNQADDYGGAVVNIRTDAVFTHCTFTGNRGDTFGGAVLNDSSDTVFGNCIIWNNSANGVTNTAAASIDSLNGTTSISYCDIENSGGSAAWVAALGTDGGGNVEIDPQFLAVTDPATAPTANGDARVAQISPVVDAALSTLDADGPLAGTQTVADYGIDVRGSARVVDGDGDEIAAPDMGAYEFGGSVIFVDADATGNNTGTTWANAYTSLGDALNAAQPPSEIWVAEGVYYPDEGGGQSDNDPNAHFPLVNGVSVYGGFAGNETDRDERDPAQHPCVCSGDLDKNDPVDADGVLADADLAAGRNAYNVFYYDWVNGDPSNQSMVMDGMIVTAGVADGSNPRYYGAAIYADSRMDLVLQGCEFHGNRATRTPGAVYLRRQGSVMTDCRFAGNTGSSMAAASVNGRIERCHFSNNRVTGDIAAIQVSTGTIVDCVFENNHADGSGGALGLGGSATAVGCKLLGNSAGQYGGAVKIYAGSRLESCLFAGNQANWSGAIEIANATGPGIIYNCEFRGNSALYGGVSSLIGEEKLVFTNCSFGGNLGTYSGGVFFNSNNRDNSAEFVLNNCVFWNNSSAGSITSPSATLDYSSTTSGYLLAAVTFSHCVVQGSGGSADWNPIFGTDDGGNLDTDPAFASAPDPALAPTISGDLSPLGYSSAIDAGDGTADLDGGGSGTEMASDLTADLGGKLRVVDGDLNNLARIDIGAHEFDGLPVVMPVGTLVVRPGGPDQAGAIDLAAVFGGVPTSFGVSAVEPSGIVNVSVDSFTGLLDFAFVSGATGVVNVTVTASDAAGKLGVHQFVIALVPEVLRVDRDVAGGAQDGSSWADAFPTLQDALAVAVVSQEIWVAEGVYFPDEGIAQVADDTGASFSLVPGAKLFGGFDGSEGDRSARDPAMHPTVLSGDLAQDDTVDGDGVTVTWADRSGSNADKVVSAAFGVGEDVELDGFIVTAGAQRGLEVDSSGSPVVRDCVFAGNNAGAWDGANCGTRYERCRFLSNQTGAENLDGASPVFDSCRLQGNQNGGYSARERCAVLFANTLFSGNGGGGVNLVYDSRAVLTNCTLSGNGRTAVVVSQGGHVDLSNCVVWENLENGNTRHSPGSSLYVGAGTNPSTALVRNSVIANSGGSGGWVFDVAFDGGGNLDIDPLFVGPIDPSDGLSTAGDFRLRGYSPVLDSGSNSLDVDGDGPGTGTVGELSLDLPGQARVADSNLDGTATVEPGAYEYVGLPVLNPVGLLRYDPGSAPATAVIDLGQVFGGSPTTFALVNVEPSGLVTPVVDGATGQVDFSFAAGAGSVDLVVSAEDAGGRTGEHRFTVAVVPPVIRVDREVVGGSGDGTSWPDAMAFLRDAIDLAVPGVEIWVKEGVHYPDEGASTTDNDRFASFEPTDGVEIYGGFSGVETQRSQRDPVAHPTVLSGDLEGNDVTNANGVVEVTANIVGDNAYNVVRALVRPGPGTVLDGFTITAGQANGSGENYYQGGGLFTRDGADPTLRSCRFEGNSGSRGAAVAHIYRGMGSLEDCVFVANVPIHGTGSGCVRITNYASPRYLSCRFESSNTDGVEVTSDGGGTFDDCVFDGVPGSSLRVGDSYNSGIEVLLRGCKILNGTNGAAVVVEHDARVRLENCVVSGTADRGLYCRYNAVLTAVGCVISGNSSTSGAGIYNDGATATLTNCTLTGNIATGAGGAVWDRWESGYSNPDKFVTLQNCIIWNNSSQGTRYSLRASVYSQANNSNGSGTPTTVRNCIVENSGGSGNWAGQLGADGGGNLDLDPRFVAGLDPAAAPSSAGDFQLRAASPAIDQGAASADLDGPGPGVETISSLAEDVADTDRFLDGNGDSAAAIDLGAHEYDGLPVLQAVAPLLYPPDSPALAGEIDLSEVFGGNPDSFSLVNVSPGGLLGVVVNPLSGLVDFSFTPGTTGIVTVTVGAGNSAGAIGEHQFTVTVAEPVLHVDPSVAGGALDGSSWADAFATLQDALAGAVAGQEIWLSAGVHYPDQGAGQVNDDRSSTFEMVDGVAVYGGFEGDELQRADRDPSLHLTVLSGDIDGNDTTDSDGVVRDPANVTGSNAYHVVTAQGGVGRTAVLDGLVLTAGMADSNAINQWDRYGGGFVSLYSKPTLSNCELVGNQAISGGAMACYSDTQPRVTHCTISHSGGGGVTLRYGTKAEFSDCSFSTTTGGNAALYVSQGAASRLERCTFSGNQGRAIYAARDTDTQLISCAIFGNGGTGVYLYTSSSREQKTEITNCTITGNQGGGIFVDRGVKLRLNNSIVWLNLFSATDPFDPRASINRGSSPISNDDVLIRSCLIEHAGGSGAWDPYFGTDLGGNIEIDPEFRADADPYSAPNEVGDLRLQPFSSILDLGYNDADLDGDGPGSATVATLTSGLGGNPRVADGNQDGALIVDPGAYEFVGMPVINPVGPLFYLPDSPPVPGAIDLSTVFGGGANSFGLVGLTPAGIANATVHPATGVVDLSFVPGMSGVVDLEVSAANAMGGSGSYTIQIIVPQALHVDSSVAGGTGDGSSWTNAMAHLQDALAVAVPGQEIWVANGLYKPDEGGDHVNDDRDATFTLLEGVSIYGGFSGNETMRDQRDPTVNFSVLSGDIDGNDSTDANGLVLDVTGIAGGNSHHLMTCDSLLTNDTVIDGLWFTGGQAQEVTPVDSERWQGSALKALYGSPLFRSCVFQGNLSRSGGAVWLRYTRDSVFDDCRFKANEASETNFRGGAFVAGDKSNTTLRDCLFDGNKAHRAGGLYSNNHTRLILERCTFENNIGTSGDAAAYISGSQALRTDVLDCTFTGNMAASSGQYALNFYNVSALTVSNSSFTGNTGKGAGFSSCSGTFIDDCDFSLNQGTGVYVNACVPIEFRDCYIRGNTGNSGGGLEIRSSSLRMVGCVISGNDTTGLGGGIYSQYESGLQVLTNCTISGNRALNRGGGMVFDNIGPQLQNTIIYGNLSVNYPGNSEYYDRSPWLDHSLVGGYNTSPPNLATDPLFVVPVDPNTAPTIAGDLRLQAASPCIGAGLNTADLDPTDPGTEFIMDVALDIGGDPRIVGAFIDMGAYEFGYGGMPDTDLDGLPNDYERMLTMPSSETALDPAADDDGDQSGELLEWMMGMDRGVSDVSLRPVGFLIEEAGTSYLAIRYRRNRLALGTLDIGVERSTDLGITDGWDSGETVVVSVTPVAGEPGIEMVVERSIFPVAGGQEMLRVRGTIPGSP